MSYWGLDRGGNGEGINKLLEHNLKEQPTRFAAD